MPRHRRVRPLIVAATLAALFLVLLAPARAATPATGRVSAMEPTTTWEGGPFLVPNPTEPTDCVVPDVPFCDSFALEIGALTEVAPDVVVSVAAHSSSDVLNLAIYDAAGAKVAESSGIGSSQTVVLERVQPGTYSVRTELFLGVPNQSGYRGTAAVGDGQTFDLSQECLVEQTQLAFAPDAGQWVDLDVLVLLDGVDETHARQFFTVVSQPYEELRVRVVPTFEVASPPFTQTASTELLDEARARFPEGKVPPEFDIVEVLTSKDIHALGQSAVAGQADCLGGLAYDERSFNVSEAGTPGGEGGIPFGPVTLGANLAAKITAHEIGHLLGGQHHYANCVEGIDADVAAEQADTAPCTLMFNAADFVSLHFGTVNAKIVRGYALTYAAANDGLAACAGKQKKQGCKPTRERPRPHGAGPRWVDGRRRYHRSSPFRRGRSSVG